MSTTTIRRGQRYYTDSGYNEHDGLTNGQWVKGKAGVWTWQPTPMADYADNKIACPLCEATIHETCRTREGNRTRDHLEREIPRLCGCGAPLGWKKRSCETCVLENARASKRRYRERLKTAEAA